MEFPLEKGSYRFTGEFGDPGARWSSGFHTGLDFAAPVGTPVRAAKTGSVTVAKSPWGGPNLVTIDHGDGLSTLYAHMSYTHLQTGDQVNAGQIIGQVGERPDGPEQQEASGHQQLRGELGARRALVRESRHRPEHERRGEDLGRHARDPQRMEAVELAPVLVHHGRHSRLQRGMELLGRHRRLLACLLEHGARLHPMLEAVQIQLHPVHQQ